MIIQNLTEQQLIDQRLRFRLNYLNHVECWNHLGRHTGDTTVDFPYQNWNTSPAPLFRKNGQLFTPTSIDSTNGTIVYSNKLYSDDITCDYNFIYFSDTQLKAFFDDAMSKYNRLAPNTSYDFTAYPEYIIEWLVSSTYLMALQTFMMDLTMWRTSLIFNPTATAAWLQQVSGSIEADLGRFIKPRAITPHVVAQGRWKVPSYVNESTWQQYTVIRT